MCVYNVNEVYFVHHNYKETIKLNVDDILLLITKQKNKRGKISNVMSMSYFDQKFRTLRNKLTSTFGNDDMLKFNHNLAPKITLEYLPVLILKLFELLDSMIDEVENLRENMEALNKQNNDIYSPSNLKKNVININLDQSADKKEKVIRKICATKNKTQNRLLKSSLLLTENF